ncbi:MAG: hypothetical protein SGPRY_014389 [Prymnesium sp.]
MPQRCHARLHTDYMGEQAPVWGLGSPGFHLRDAAECCAACEAHARVCGKRGAERSAWWPQRPELRCGSAPACNIWVFCPEEQCFAFDIHKHTKGLELALGLGLELWLGGWWGLQLAGECWLKQQSTNISRPKDPHEGHTSFPEAMRRAPRKVWPWPVDERIWPHGIPKDVPWISGVLAPPEVEVVSAPANDRWRHRWCAKHSATYGPCE